LRASTGVATISQTTASASGAKGTPTYGITVAGFQPCGHSETDAHFLPGYAAGATCVLPLKTAFNASSIASAKSRDCVRAARFDAANRSLFASGSIHDPLRIGVLCD
jgi:hypothetical protein